MFHFLGIVAEEDYQEGRIIPSYILCQAQAKSENRSGWRVIKQNEDSPFLNMPKVLVTSPSGHEDMIDFLSAYRTRDHMHQDRHYKHEDTMKYYPVGAMFWFECDEHGRPGSYAVFIKPVPDKKKRGTDDGFQRLKEARGKEMPVKEILSRDPKLLDDEYSEVKPKLYQQPVKE